MKFVKISIVTFLSVCLDLCFCQYFTSSFEIERLLDTERTLLDNLNTYFKRQEKNEITFGEDVLSFVKLAGQRNREINRNHDYDNPLTTFHIVKRAVQDWAELKEKLTCTGDHEHDECPLLTGADVIRNVLKQDSTKWPTDLDLTLAVDALLNVQNVYNISIDTLTQGKIGHAVVQPLSGDDIFFIANTAKDHGKSYEAITWFQYLVTNLKEFPSRDFTTGSLYRRFAASYFEHGMQKKAVSVLEEYLQQDPADKGVSRDLDYYTSRTAGQDEPMEVQRFTGSSKKIEERLKYEAICRNISQGSSGYSGNLRCYLRCLYNTYGVSKVEVLSVRPRIERIYEVISSSEAASFQSAGEKSFGKLQQALPLKDKRRGSMQSLVSGPICERANVICLNLTNKLEIMTNFQMFMTRGVHSSECYQVVNEGLGSVQNFVVDSWSKNQFPFPMSGNRLATISLQLSDVQFGGQIVFPRTNLAIPVVKGSAVIWWNLKRDGLPDPRSIHINCPTVVGSNWVAVKHILYNNQIFRRL